MDNSLLANLPAELRVRIYEHVLHRSGGVTLVWDSTGRRLVLSTTTTSGQIPAETQSLALMSTCRHINAECDRMFFKINTFVLDYSRISLWDVAYGVSSDQLSKTLGASNMAACGAITINTGSFLAINSDEIHAWVVERLISVIPKLRQFQVPVSIKFRLITSFPCKHELCIDSFDLASLEALYYAAVAKVNDQRALCGDTSHTNVWEEVVRYRLGGEYHPRRLIPSSQ